MLLFIYVDSITIPILMKLFETNIVASSLLDLYKSLSTFSSFASFSSFICVGLKEKKAVSLPDISPEKINNINNIIKFSTIVMLMGLIVMFNAKEHMRK